MALSNVHLSLGDVLAMPTCSRVKLEKFHGKMLLLIGYVGCLVTFGCAVLSTVDASEGADAAKVASLGSRLSASADSSEFSGQKSSDVAAAPGPEAPAEGAPVSQQSGLSATEGSQTDSSAVDKSSSSKLMDNGHRHGLEEEGKAGKEQKREKQCTPTDADTIFWRHSDSPYLQAPLAPEQESNELPEALQPSNPFYNLLLTCARMYLAQVEPTKTCVQTGLEKAQRFPLTDGCIDCFMHSLQCGASNCQLACFSDSCAKSCTECNETNCRHALKECSGLSELPPACVASTDVPEGTEETPLQEGWDQIYASLGISPEENE